MDEPQAVMTPHQPPLPEDVERVLVMGDLAQLSPEHRMAYYQAVCKSLGLNPLTKPFEYLTLNGKLRLYALRDCTDQLRKIHGVSIYISSRERLGDVYIVTARAKDRTGREDESTGVVTVGHLKGDALANALMKCETKAKRRVTLSIAGLGWLDETELETLPPHGGRSAPAAEGAGSPGPVDDHPTHDQVSELFDLGLSALHDLTAVGHTIRGAMGLSRDARLTKKLVRAQMTMEEYRSVKAQFEGEIKRQVETDVEDHQPPQNGAESTIAAGEVAEASAPDERAPEGESALQTIFVSQEEVDELVALGRKAGQGWPLNVGRFVSAHNAGRIPRSHYEQKMEEIVKAWQARERD